MRRKSKTTKEMLALIANLNPNIDVIKLHLGSNTLEKDRAIVVFLMPPSSDWDAEEEGELLSFLLYCLFPSTTIRKMEDCNLLSHLEKRKLFEELIKQFRVKY